MPGDSVSSAFSPNSMDGLFLGSEFRRPENRLFRDNRDNPTPAPKSCKIMRVCAIYCMAWANRFGRSPPAAQAYNRNYFCDRSNPYIFADRFKFLTHRPERLAFLFTDRDLILGSSSPARIRNWGRVCIFGLGPSLRPFKFHHRPCPSVPRKAQH